MASSTATRARQSYTTEQVIQNIFADEDSENEQVESETDESEEEETSGENDEHIQVEAVEEPPVRGRGAIRRRGVRTRGGNRGGNRNQARLVAQTQKEAELETKWKHQDQQPNIPDFTGESKINFDLPEAATTLDFLDLFLDDGFFDMLTLQTNLYAAQYREIHVILPRYSRARNWKDVTNAEMREFMALHLLTGIVRKPEISQYRSTDPLLKSPIFNEVMSRNRLQAILEFLHFADNLNYDVNEPNRDRLFKVRPVVDYLVSKFKTVYTPQMNVSIDEELLLWKGRLGFK